MSHLATLGFYLFEEVIMNSQMSSPEITELAEAMIQVQQTLSPALKDAENTFTNSRSCVPSSGVIPS
ncbi:protein of unknown function [Pseudodesulfovibrio profundus]|uniref:Uncharacterized protein n=1 Tax=Pseudodesulfovibrio profundus TaxID=57320 RepID=A0A2C8F6P3_9BACT|nr:protein of unknown function [Pseudodesulfovibrio profundus]